MALEAEMAPLNLELYISSERIALRKRVLRESIRIDEEWNRALGAVEDVNLRIKLLIQNCKSGEAAPWIKKRTELQEKIRKLEDQWKDTQKSLESTERVIDTAIESYAQESRFVLTSSMQQKLPRELRDMVFTELLESTKQQFHQRDLYVDHENGYISYGSTPGGSLLHLVTCVQVLGEVAFQELGERVPIVNKRTQEKQQRERERPRKEWERQQKVRNGRG